MSEPLYLGIDIGGTKSAVSILSESKGVMNREAFPTQGEQGPERGVAEMVAVSKRLMAGKEIAAVGISVGAMFDPRTGLFGDAPHLPKWKGFPIVETIRREFSLPVAADNDANACALAEWRFGAGEGADHMAFLTFGTGLGAGLILNRRVYHGASALAGEIGATRIASDGPPVRDKPGCLEGFASGAGIAGLVEMRLPQFSGVTELRLGSSAREVAEAAERGDSFALEIMNEAGDSLGRGLAILLDLLNLEVIVIGSIFVRCESLLRPPMDAALRRDAMPTAVAACRIVPAALGESIGDYAALAMALSVSGKKPEF